MELLKRYNEGLWDPFSDFGNFAGVTLRGKEAFQPDIEIHEEADHYALSADLPGFKKEDFDISVQGNTLTLKGERKQEKERKEKGAYFSEKYYGAFSRTLEFPTEIQTDKVKASYKDGVLEVNLPKSESSKPKQISVEVK
jgi:HSP20 family protein